jgi:hypothetical protein
MLLMLDFVAEFTGNVERRQRPLTIDYPALRHKTHILRNVGDADVHRP